MRLRTLLVAFTFTLIVASGQPRWVLDWQDEFDGTAIDSARWTFDLGGRGWGNNELESYTSRPENAFLQDGMLVIRAIAEDFTGADGIARKYTSARLKSLGRFSQTYGRFEARIRIPYGQGIWPAFWMLGDDITTKGWPACGEIDIMENIGKEPSIVHGTLHGPGYSGGGGLTGQYALPSGARFADDFHLYAVEWEPAEMRWFVDGALYKTVTTRDLPSGTRWVFDHPFHLLLNLAVGGNWPGNPDASTSFPQSMLVDYVRVYHRMNNRSGR